METEQALALIERTVRKAIRAVVPDWHSQLDTTETGRAVSWQSNEQKKRAGVVSGGDLLDFLMTPRLVEMYTHNAEALRPVLGDPERVQSLLAFVSDVRNTPAHSRELVAYERDLISGTAGYLSNMLALWETANDEVARHYPVITGARDSFGREGLESFNAYTNPIRVDVGVEVEITAQATQARDRSIRWYIGTASRPEQIVEQYVPFGPPRQLPPNAWGSSIRYRYRFTEADVAEHIDLAVVISSSDPFHRSGVVDDLRTFRFAVSPPR